jgi:hypothetical protein
LSADIWAALDPERSPAEPTRERRQARWALRGRGLLVSERGRFAIAVSPLLLVYALGQWIVLTGVGSFASVLGFGGVIFNTLTAGILPVLLLVASRRKGDCIPAVAYGVLGHPAFTVGVCLVSIANLVVHGLVIYRDPWSRASALALALVAAGVILALLRRRAFDADQ